jgi:hypothetical protein
VTTLPGRHRLTLAATGRDTAQILHRYFGQPSSAGALDATHATAQEARIRALVAAIVARPQADTRAR